MPELPEVETIRQDLRKMVVGQQITNVWLSAKAIIKNTKPFFLKTLKNNYLKEISRIGKLIIFVLPGDKYLLTHLKMTGQLIYKRKFKVIAGGHPEPSLEQLPNKFTRIIFEFKNDGKLYFNDIRRFGYMQIVDQAGLEKIKQKFGLEPIDKRFSFEYFKKVLKNKNKPIKVALMDQDKISGIGNIYASEICFEARVRPQKKASALSPKELQLLYKASVKVLQVAVKNRGTTFSDYRDCEGEGGYHAKFLKVYDREGLKCKRNDGGEITKIVLGGRGSFYCPICQK